MVPHRAPSTKGEPLVGAELCVPAGTPNERMLDYCDRFRGLVVALLRPLDSIDKLNRSKVDILCALELDGRRVSLLARQMIIELEKIQ